MTPQSQKILDEMQVRKSRKQKAGFRAWLCRELETAGWTVTVEHARLDPLAGYNVVAGDPEQAKVLYTAHYDTQAVLPIPNFITPRNPLFYVLYQLLIVIPMLAAVAAAEILLIFLTEALGASELLWWLAPLCSVLICVFFIWWIIDGPANKHTANDNTSGVVTLVETALALPPELREKVCFVFFDNEEKGMFGSIGFSSKHKRVKKNTLVINFDCVGDGDSIQFFPKGGLKKDAAALEAIEAAFLPSGGKEVQVVRGFGFYPSDNANFKKGAGVCALKHKKALGYYMDRIHTAKDTVCDERNIALLRDGAVRLLLFLERKSKQKEL